MCWSGEASAVIATLGFSSAFYAAYKKESKLLWFPLGYFSLMEALQAYTYSVIDNCELPANQMATLLGYLHITFQPFFVNAVALYFIPKRIARKIAPFVYSVCFAAAIIMLIKVYPFAWAEQCDPTSRPMCGKLICSFHGNWHIAWSLPINEIGHNIPSYLIAAFILPLCYGSWRWALYHLITGPILARLTTSNIHEWPAIWCLLSIDLLVIITNTPVRNMMYVKSWFLWRWSGRKNSPGDREIKTTEYDYNQSSQPRLIDA